MCPVSRSLDFQMLRRLERENEKRKRKNKQTKKLLKSAAVSFPQQLRIILIVFSPQICIVKLVKMISFRLNSTVLALYSAFLSPL